MNWIVRWQKLQKWLFKFPQKIQINIHNSLTNQSILILIRIVALLILSFRYYLSIIYYESAFNIVEYLTQLGFALTWIYFATVVEDYFLNRRKAKISKSLKDWINLIFEVAICIQSVVTILFWMVLYDFSTKLEPVSFLKQVGIHGFPFLCLLLDLAFNIYQFPRRHLIVALAVGISYLALNITYSLLVKPIYPPLTWISAVSYIYIIGSIILVIIFHVSIGKYWEKYRKPKLKLYAMESESVIYGEIID